MAEVHDTIWDDGDNIALSRLPGDIHAEVAVIGAGVSGLTTAYLLATAGIPVVVVEADGIGAGMTGRSTAHLSAAVDGGWRKMVSSLGIADASTLARGYRNGIEAVHDLAVTLPDACDYAWVNGELQGSWGEQSTLIAEYTAAKSAGLLVAPIETSRSAEDSWSIRFARQGRLHPIKYVRGIAQKLLSEGTAIFQGKLKGFRELSHGVELCLEGDRVITAKRGAILAHHLALDVNYPGVTISKRRSYVITASVTDPVIEDTITWDLSHPYHYTRLVPREGGFPTLMAGGADHAVEKQVNPKAHFNSVERWMRKRYPHTGIVQKCWFGDLKQTSDNLAILGQLPGYQKTYVIDGDAGLGFNHAMIGAQIIRDHLLRRDNKLAKLFAPSRPNAFAR